MNKYDLTMLDEVYNSCWRYWVLQGLEEEQAHTMALNDVERMDNDKMLVIKGFYLDCLNFWIERGCKENKAAIMAFHDIERITSKALIPVFPLKISEQAKMEYIKMKMGNI